ncbi:hypothetical protein [Glycomyces sp. MUSA5-2]|uniref:hypothetical protein n=1 Tax=Glycomyces sp. MUSA5-2 TaxID=2053002 RepID=UPI00300A24F7
MSTAFHDLLRVRTAQRRFRAPARGHRQGAIAIDSEPLPLLRGPVWNRGAGVAESVIAVFAVFLLLWFGIQLGIWAHAHHVAAAAAQTALATARTEDGSASSGAATGAASLGINAGGSLEDASITVDRGAETVTVTVTGHAPGVIPVPNWWGVTASATGPVERFVPTGEGG